MPKERGKEGCLTAEQSTRAQRLANHAAILIVTDNSSSTSRHRELFLNFYKILFFTAKRLLPKIHVI